MLGTKLTFAFAVTLLVLFITEENEVNAAPEPCKHMMSYMFKKPEKLTKPKEHKEKMEKDKKKDLLKNWEKMIGKMLRRALHLEDEEESTVKPRVGAMEDILANYINFLTYLWNIN